MTTTIAQAFNHFLETGLNEQQKAAVLQKNNAVLIVAGAGSGKTRVITSRIANLIVNENIQPRSIVALTFTNKAAGEMKERLIHQFQTSYRLPFIGTFHSYCLLLLRTNAHLLPFPQFSILDGDDQLDLIKKIIKKYAVAKHITASQLLYQISKYKNRAFNTDPSIHPASPGTQGGRVIDEISFTPLVRSIYLEYEAEKAQTHCLDFDDLITQVLQLLKTNSLFKENFQRNVRHILVDEYQDTSHVQHQLLLEMARRDDTCILDSICAVGDEDQSIYSWRGATVTNMLKFQSDFAPVTTIKIEQNYRSVQPILEAANQVIANNRLRNPKNLWSTREAKNRMLFLSCRTGDQEAEIIAKLIKLASRTKRRDSMAILYRTHYLSRPLEEALIHQAIPYHIIGGIRFYERKEIKDLLAYLRLIVNPYDKISLLRVINTPSRGLGQKFEEQMLETWRINPLFDFKQLILWMIDSEDIALTPSKTGSLKDFLDLYSKLDKDGSPKSTLEAIITHIEYLSHLAAAYDPREAQTKIENVQEFAQAITVFESKKSQNSEILGSMLENFLYEVALLQEKFNDEENGDFVQMMTLHAAKGLEFDTIIIAGLEEGLLPNQRSLTTNEELEEERRLMYVGMTRAKEHLILTNAYSRFTFGQIVDQAPSRFLDEIPKKLLLHVDLDKTPIFQALDYIEQWLTGTISHGTLSTPETIRKTPTYQIPRHLHPAAGRSGITLETSAPARTSGVWVKNQSVHHEKFGLGLITEIEKAPEDEFYLTIAFKAGKKKILSRFVQKK